MGENESMKIGIISMQRVVNYGSFLQAYGLKKTIEGLGHEVIFLDYKVEPPVVEYDKKRMVRYQIKNIAPLRKLIRLANYKLKGPESFYYFTYLYENEYLKKINVTDKRIYREKVDVLVVGSDEVFNCLQPEIKVGFSKELFGQDANAKKIISYAASFGYTTLAGLRKYGVEQKVAGWLKSFDALSVRDDNSVEILKQLGIEKISKNVDPVIISNYDREIPASVPYHDYIVLYTYAGRSYSDAEVEQIVSFAKRNNKKIMTIGKHKDWSDIKIQADPFEVLAYFQHADFIFTDTFHGTVFSLKYNRPFATLIRDDNSAKLRDLLQTFGLADREISDVSRLQEYYDKPIDFTDCNRIIAEQREKSLAYLKSELSGN